MQWLLSMRQDDGGWAIPTRTLGLSLNAMLTAGETFEPDRGRPASHLITGIVLPALAAHPANGTRLTPAAPPGWSSRGSSAGTSTPTGLRRRIGSSSPIPSGGPACCARSAPSPGSACGAGDPDIARSVAWFIDHQDHGGLWNTGRNRPKGSHSDLWVGLAICRMLNAISA
jgi:hypothetical protein